MNSIVKLMLLLLPFFNSLLLYSQVTITEIGNTEEKIVLKPEPYDSITNWGIYQHLGYYKQYIGLQIYLPPIHSPKFGEYPETFYIRSLEFYYNYNQKFCKKNLRLDEGKYSSGMQPVKEYAAPDMQNFLFSIKPITIKTEIARYKYEIWNKETYSHEWKEYVYDSLITFVYKPFHYYYKDHLNGVCSDSSKVSNAYFTILNVFYGDTAKKMWEEFNDILLKYRSLKNICINDEDFSKNYGPPDVIFQLKNNSNNDTLYCIDVINKFILVPYFVKQQKLFENKYFIYDDKTLDGSYIINSAFKKFDTRFIIKYEADNGSEISTYKTVTVLPGSRWFCTKVTLLKPLYDIYYILKNDKDEQIELPKSEMQGFINEPDYLERKANIKSQNEQLIAKKNHEEFIRKENERKLVENHKIECTNKFGQQNGELIAQGKVKIGMSIEMCQMAWGFPLWTKKTITENKTSEDWFYGGGYNLYFVNGILKRIEE